MIFFSSDHHFFDVNFLRYNYGRCVKYGKDVNIINKFMIESQNNQVDITDIVYYIGDFSSAKISITIELIKKLNGNIKLLIGNHDKFKTSGIVIPNKLEILQNGIYRLYHNEIIFNLFHYPLKEQPDYYNRSIHLHGHTHGKQNGYDDRAIDVGFDNNDYKLLSIDNIINMVKLN